MARLFDVLVFPLFIPIIIIWDIIARILSFIAPFLIFPSLITASKFYQAVPFAPAAFKRQGIKGFYMRLGFEATYCMNVVRRFLTLPLRPYLPSVYIMGFPKCGTTSLANYMKLHPALSGIDGLPWHEVLSKESHYYNGILGRNSACSKTMYKSFFPTVFTRWWAECVRGVDKWMCYDACPLPACLPYTAKRIHALTPNAKLIFMLRDPVSGCFSAEIMLRNIGMDLKWSFMEDLVPSDPRFSETPGDVAFWKMLSTLRPDEPLPDGMMDQFYERCSTVLRCGQYSERIKPFLDTFPKENIMFIDFKEFVTNTEAVVNQVLNFIGVDTSLYTYKELPAGMGKEGDRRGRRMHPSVKRKLAEYFRDYNYKLYSMLGRDFGWCEEDVEGGKEEKQGGVIRRNSTVSRGVSVPVRVVSIVANASGESRFD